MLVKKTCLTCSKDSLLEQVEENNPRGNQPTQIHLENGHQTGGSGGDKWHMAKVCRLSSE